MAKSEQPANPAEQPQLSDRQWDVLGRVAKQESVAAEKGKRIDLTLNSLVNRDLIEKVEAPGKPTVYRALTAGQKALEIQSKPAEPKAPEAEKKEVPGAGGAPMAPVVEPGVPGAKFVPRKGQIVWSLDGEGDRKIPYYRVVDVRIVDAKLETWSGASWEPVAGWQRFGSLEALSDEELAEAKKAGIPVG